MQVTVLYVEGCPNWPLAESRVAEAIERLGRQDITLTRRIVRSPQEAEQLSFQGSPTVLVDGQDPFADRHGAVGLSCRVYATAAGLDGAPMIDQLIEALGGGLSA